MDDDSCRGCNATTGWLWMIGNEHWCPSCMAGEIERLRAIADKLPKTADGVPVVPGMVLWPPVDCWLPPLNEGEESQEAGGTVGMTVRDILTGDDVTEYAAIERCYSTREAAEAEKE